MKYKQTVQKLHQIKWTHLINQNDITQLMYISYITAIEFAESLRIALLLYSEDVSLQKMAKGELQTSNLLFNGYNKKGDHYKFLEYFLLKGGGIHSKIVGFDVRTVQVAEITIPENVVSATENYLNDVRKLPKSLRAMSIFSREEELSGIFTKILKNQIFDYPLLGEMLSAYKYYLKRHIQLDSEDGGHADLIKDFSITDEVDQFYKLRLKLYLDSFPILLEK